MASKEAVIHELLREEHTDIKRAEMIKKFFSKSKFINGQYSLIQTDRRCLKSSKPCQQSADSYYKRL